MLIRFEPNMRGLISIFSNFSAFVESLDRHTCAAQDNKELAGRASISYKRKQTATPFLEFATGVLRVLTNRGAG